MAYAQPEQTPTKQQDCLEIENLPGFPTKVFHQVNVSYEGIEKLHSNPDIYGIPNFLTDDECQRLIKKTSNHYIPCLARNEVTGKVQEDPTRTSTNANVPQVEVPSIVSKLTSLGNCNADQLEILQVLHYKNGQKFMPHTDGFEGPMSACGFVDSGRLVTIFVYLNDVKEGGTTQFTKLSLVVPKRGMAIVHFPSTMALQEDYGPNIEVA